MNNSWTTADYALIISLFSLFFAFAGFVWNIWSKFIFPKPKVRVFASFSWFDPAAKMIVSRTRYGLPLEFSSHANLIHPSICISATNHGPGEVILTMPVASSSRFGVGNKENLATLNAYNDYPSDLKSRGPFSGGLPKSLQAGEQFSQYFPASPHWFDEPRLRLFGFVDSLGRCHFCNRANGREIRKLVTKPILDSLKK